MTAAAGAPVVVTGLGALTPLGGDVTSTWEGMLAGRSGITRLDDEWAREFPARLVARMSKAFSLIWRTVLIPASGRKKPKWSGKSLKAHATVSPLVRSSTSKSTPSVARMNLALALAVAGLALRAANVCVTRPASQVRM